LQNRFFRGIQINQGYTKGEFTANFTKTTVTVTNPAGTRVTGTVSTVGQYLVVKWSDGTAISSLWQPEGGPETDFLSWAWSAVGGPPPTSYNDAMITQGQTEYEFVSCTPGKAACNFHL